MVDLVKLRKKAKEKRLEEAPSARQEATPSAPPPPPAERSSAARRGSRRGSSPAPAAPSADAESTSLVPAPEVAPSVPRPEPAERENRVQLGGGAERLERFRQTAGVLAAEEKVAATEVAESEQMELLTFMMGTEHYAVLIDSIVEIILPRTPTRVPNADPAVVGVISLRGTIVTILDVRRRLGHRGGAGGDPRIIVVERSGETVGFLVDRVSRVIKVDPLEIGGHPVVAAAEQSQYIGGVIQQGKSIFILLDLEKLIQA